MISKGIQMKTFKQSIALALSSLMAGAALWAESSIGVASTRGTMTVNQALVRGNTNLMNGASVGTTDSTSLVEFQNGSTLLLGQKSRAKVHSRRAKLDQGSIHFSSGGGYEIEALGIVIAGTNGEPSSAQIAYVSPTRILITPVKGSIRVLDKEQVLVASLNAGSNYYAENQTGTGSSSEQPQAQPAGNPRKSSEKKKNMIKRPAVLVTIATVGVLGASIGVIQNTTSR